MSHVPLRSVRNGSLALLGAAVLVVLLALPALAQTITVTADGVSPDPLTIEVGQAVDFVNETDDEVRFFDDGERWDSGPLAPSDVFTITFDEPGRVTYTSDTGDLAGAIIVVDPEEQAEGMAATGIDAALMAMLALGGLIGGGFLLRRAAV